MAAPKTAQAYLYQADPPIDDLPALFDKILAAPEEKRYVKRANRTTSYAIPFHDQSGIGLWSLREDAPDVHRDGSIEPWDLSAEVAEGSYFRFFDDNTVAMVATGHGPRTTALSSYLDIAVGHDAIFNPILRSDTSFFVASIDQVKRIELGVTIDSVDVVRDVDAALGRALESVISEAGSTKIRIILDGADTEDRATLWGRMKGVMRDLAGHEDLSQLGKARLTVPGELRGEEDIDLLKDRIGYQVEVPAAGVNQVTAFTVAATAYAHYRDDFG